MDLQSGEKSESRGVRVSSEAEQGHAPTSCFSSHTINVRHLCGLFNVTFFTLSCYVMLISLFKMAPQV